jgi:hypothetical protein
VVDDSGAQYPLLIDPTFSQQAYVKASNTGTGDSFGTSVAVDGDTVVVGAPYEDSSSTGVGGLDNDSASGSGAAYVFIRTGTTWTQQAYVKASNTGTGDQFGYSVAVDGDTVVVGAPLEDSSSTGVGGLDNDSADGSGAAYVFIRTGTTWSQQAYVKASNTGAGDYFGYSVAVDGDTVVVGAPYEDSSSTGVGGAVNESASGSGAAYVFIRTGTTWSQQAYVKASNTGTGDSFGYSVAVDGDTVVVGARLEDSSSTGVGGAVNESANGSGAAYVFTRTGTTWSQQAYVKASNTGAGDDFGYSVAVDGDTVVVGAILEDSSSTGVGGAVNESASGSGAAYVFIRTGTTWSQQAYVKASNTGAGDRFGYSVAVDGDTVVVGAPLEDSSSTGVGGAVNDSASDSGAAYVFTRTGTTWTEQAYVKASNTGAGDYFGYSVAVDGDTVVVGALSEDIFAGAAYMFLITADSAPQQVATSGAAGVPGIFLTLTGGVGSLVSQATLRFGADRAAREGGFVVTLISETTPATQRILAVGAFNGGGHLDDRVSMPALGAGTYLVILVGVGPGGEALRLGNRFSVNGAGQYVSITAELLQSSL